MCFPGTSSFPEMYLDSANRRIDSGHTVLHSYYLALEIERKLSRVVRLAK